MIDMFGDQAFWKDDYLFVRIEKEQADPSFIEKSHEII